jgi:hypothetical protein
MQNNIVLETVNLYIATMPLEGMDAEHPSFHALCDIEAKLFSNLMKMTEAEKGEYRAAIVKHLIDNKEILTESEAEAVLVQAPDLHKKYLNDIGAGRWLNCNVYSEHEHHERVFRMELGI